MGYFYNVLAPKKAANLTVNTELLRIAKEMKINISATLEQALIERIREEKTREWKKQNKEAIAQYNQRIETHGVFSDGLRKF